MIRINLKKLIIFISILTAFTVFDMKQLTAQVQGPQQQEIKWLSVGGLRHWFSSGGAELEYGRRGRTGFVNVDQIDGLIYPSEYTNNKGVSASTSSWIGTTNFEEVLGPYAGKKTYAQKVVSIGPRILNLGNDVYAEDFTLVGNSDHPAVYVDDALASLRDFDDEVDIVVPDLKADRMLVNTVHTAIGVTVTRKIYAFTQQYHDNYYIHEYVFKNTGKAIDNTTSTPKIVTMDPPKTLTDVVFHWQYRLAFAGESYPGGWAPSGVSWGRNTINDAIGQDAGHPGEFKAIYSYYGPVSTAPGVLEDIGLPRHTDGSIMAGTQFSGVVVLHADKSPQDPSNDPNQPSTTLFSGSDSNLQPVDQYDATLMTNKYNDLMTAGHPAQTQAEQIGKDPVTGWPTAFANTWGSDAGGYSSCMGFGPYDLAPGDSVKIVFAVAVAGINRAKNKEVVNKWFNQTPPYVLPNGSETSDRNTYKNTWVFSGKDSLFQSFRRAVENYQSNFEIPQPPPPPDQFTVNSGGDRIILSWSNTAESWPNFDGYRIYRSEGRTDTTYTMIFECEKSNVVNSFEDKTPSRGRNYFYYIQTKDDGTTNTVQPGVPLVSSRYLTMTSHEALLTRPAGGAVSFQDTVCTFAGDGIQTDFILARIPDAQTEGIVVKLNGSLAIPRANYSLVVDTLRFASAPSGTIEVTYSKYTGERISKMEEIRIVPNPFNMRSRDIQFGVDTPDRLAFYNLPPMCKIKIYTETGDLVETIDHTNGSGDELWHSLTSSKQLVVSGLYIAYFEVTEDAEVNGVKVYSKGDSIIKKFIIIR
ncbi:MAG: hypothetical protein V1720_10920 [bacterium]